MYEKFQQVKPKECLL